MHRPGTDITAGMLMHSLEGIASALNPQQGGILQSQLVRCSVVLGDKCATMVYHGLTGQTGLQWSTMVYNGLQWSTMVRQAYNGLQWSDRSTMVYNGLPWSKRSTMVYNGTNHKKDEDAFL
jgi:hypothetical protein